MFGEVDGLQQLHFGRAILVVEVFRAVVEHMRVVQKLVAAGAGRGVEP
jgi:hypothetical protein